MNGRHYLDHASSSPLRPEVVEAITTWAHAPQADPGRPYIEGRAASAAIEDARERVAALVNVRPRQVVFTSGGTEAVNWANVAGRARGSGPIVCAGVEHAAVRRSAAARGPVATLTVDRTGRVDLERLETLLGDGDPPVLVHCQFANHEVGTIQPAREVVAACRSAGVLVHVDACAALGQVRLDATALDADLVSLSAHKMGGPAGVGALVLRRGFRPEPWLRGGEQERARRAGMENLGGIVGFGAAAASLAAPGAVEAAAAAATAQRDALEAVALRVGGITVFGDREHRLPHVACFGVDDVEAEGVVLGLDQAGIAVHSGSACSSESFEPSPVLEAMGVDADHSLRLSVGWSTTDEDVAAFAERFPAVVSSLRALAS